MTWVTPALVVAGGVGASTRMVADGAMRSRWPTSFPWATFAINVSGSFLLGVLTGLVLHRHTGVDLRLVAGTGFCGGYTTFSTASFETVRLVQQSPARRRRLRARHRGGDGGCRCARADHRPLIRVGW